VAAFEVNRHDLIPARQFKRRRLSQLGEQAHIPKSLRQNLTAAQIDHAKTAIETKRETVSGMAEILGVNRSTLQRAISRTG
jgi:transcriptional regulator with PAS, ATPase and Fis domain